MSNLGLQRVTGDYVWIMDDVDVALPDALERNLEMSSAARKWALRAAVNYWAEGGKIRLDA